MRYFITGGAGFIGSNLTDVLEAMRENGIRLPRAAWMPC